MSNASPSLFRAPLGHALAAALLAVASSGRAAVFYTDKVAGQEEFFLIDDLGNLIDDGFSQAIPSDVKGGNVAPDASVILFWCAITGDAVLYLMDPVTYEYTALPHPGWLEWGPRNHSWIDEEYAAFTGSRHLWWISTVTGQYGILLSQSDCQARTGKREPCRMDVFGGTCAFHAYNDFDDQVYLADIAPNQGALGYAILPQTITHVASPFPMNRDPFFSPDGRHLGWTAAQRDYTYGVVVADLSAPGTTPARVGPVGASLQDWFPDGTMLVRVPGYAGVNSPALLRLTLQGETTLVKYVSTYYDLSNTAQCVRVNRPPTADAGPDLEILSAAQALTRVCGTGSDPDGDPIEFRWREGETLLMDWTSVAPGQPVCIELGALGPLALGEHVLRLEVREVGSGGLSSADQMILAVANTPPVADAGENLQIPGSQQVFTMVVGNGSDFDGHCLEYRWTEGEGVLAGWTPVGPGGGALLDLSTVARFPLGNHTLTLTVREVQSGGLIASDDMILTLDNSPPVAQPAPSFQEVEFDEDDIAFKAEISDFDGDLVSYEWIAAAGTIGAGWVMTVEGGEAVPVPDMAVPAGDSRFPLGENVVEFRVSDGVNPPVSYSVVVLVRDTQAPRVRPMPTVTILWPPNHELVPVTIAANATDNSGGAITLDVMVGSSEQPDQDGDGNAIPDWYVDAIDNAAGLISLRLRSERAGKGDGRTYTITVAATDASGNVGVAIVEILAPHDKRRK